jgi:hypothetical protein
MWCGADGPTFWNGERADCRRCVVIVADVDFPAYWARKFVGQERHAVEVRCSGKPFYIDNENGSGWAKVRFAGGGPQVGHGSLAVDEFPVRVIGHGKRLRVVEIARRNLAVLTEEGRLKPTEPVKVTKVEEI